MKGKPTTRDVLSNAESSVQQKCKVHGIAYWPAWGECPLCKRIRRGWRSVRWMKKKEN